eukprot:6485947-Amphidinium_carterae.1
MIRTIESLHAINPCTKEGEGVSTNNPTKLAAFVRLSQTAVRRRTGIRRGACHKLIAPCTTLQSSSGRGEGIGADVPCEAQCDQCTSAALDVLGVCSMQASPARYQEELIRLDHSMSATPPAGIAYGIDMLG